MLKPGRVVDRYTVEASIGEGGMAQVFRVRHNTLGTLHALKVLKVQSAAIRQRLVQEGKLQASIRHTNIVAVTDVIDVDGAPGLLMEYVEGPSLDVWLDRLAERGEAPTLQESERIFRGILAGVARAHRHGLVHRDLKPGNVLLEDVDGVLIPKVADFGLAKILLDESGGVSATRSGVAMGTPAYMSPEQIRDAKNVDQRTDIFALGCIFYELVAGNSPFDGPDVLSIFSALADGRYTPVEDVVPRLPVHLQNTIRASLAANRDLRPSDCAAIVSMLDGGELGERTALPPVSAATAGSLGGVGTASVSGPSRRSVRPVTAGSRSGSARRESGGETWAAGASLAPDASLIPARLPDTSAAAMDLSLDPGHSIPGPPRVGAASRPGPAPSQPAQRPAPRTSGPRWWWIGAAVAVAASALVVIVAGIAVVGLSSAEPEPAAVVAPSLLIVNTNKPAVSSGTVLVPVKTGAVSVRGDANKVVLIAPDGREVQPGPAVPEGTWRVEATFGDSTRMSTDVKVKAGATTRVECTQGRGCTVK